MSTAKGQIRESEATVYWIDMGGMLMIAPDSRMNAWPGWTRIVCRNAQETEFYSRKLAMQEFNRFRGMKVEEHLRYKEERDKRIANCKLRLAKGCISAADELATRNTLRSFELKNELLYKLLTSEPDLSRASLEIEKYDAETIRSRSNGKRQGLSDGEINTVAEMMEGVR